MLNTAQMHEDAAALGLKSYVEGGRFKVEGRLGDVMKVFAAQGCDLVNHGTKTVISYAVYNGPTHTPEHYVASISALTPEYAYAYTWADQAAWLSGG